MKRLVFAGVTVILSLCWVSVAPAANILVVAEDFDRDLDGLPDDQSFIDWLVAEGHSVDLRRGVWRWLDSDRIAELNAADLIIVSRLTDSSLYSSGSAPTQWNSVKTPLLLLNAYFTRPSRWGWVNSEAVTNSTTDSYAEAVDPKHPLFRGVPLTSLDPAGSQVVRIVDLFVGTGITSFLGTVNVGYGRLLAQPTGSGMGWIAEWDAGREFYYGSGQFAGGKRMLFCAGTQEVGSSREGEFNLTPEGRKMLRNAIAYLLGGANLIVVTDEADTDRDGLRDDHDLESFLVSEGHFVDVRPDYWHELDPDKIAELKAADLIIVSRTADSAYYDDGDEIAQWNSLPVPLLQLSAFFTRNLRWNWVATDWATIDTALVYLEVVEGNHPIFQNVPLVSLNPGDPMSPANAVSMIDPDIGSGITPLCGIAQMGNGRLIGKAVGLNLGWIAEWEAGVEFYPDAGQYAGARRLLFCAGAKEIQSVDPVTGELRSTPQGALNLTPEGRQMLRNAIAYLRLHQPLTRRMAR